jgi:IS1 family transposase
MGMNKLSKEKRAAIISALVEGNSINSTKRMCGVSKLTILRLLADVGQLCQDFHDLTVRNVKAARVQVDEIWSFVGCKEKTKKAGGYGDGDCWTFTGMDADSKLMVSYLVGLRDGGCAREFMHDLADRLVNRVQLTSDGYRVYRAAVPDAFGTDVDFAQLEKYFGSPEGASAERRYGPAVCIGTRQLVWSGDPDPKHISTSYVERQNLTIRMRNRRFTRLTNAFSKKWANHEHALALHYFVYNFVRVHMTLKTTPAIAAGVATKAYTVQDLVAMLEKEENLRANGGRINRADRT